MARTTINPTQISITGSNAGTISEGSLTSTHVFIAQAASTSAVQTITADAMQKYFSKIDLDAATDTSHRIILGAVNGGSGGAGVDDVDLKYDSGILFDPTGGGTLSLAQDASALKLGADNDVTLTHDGSTGATLASAGAFIVDGAAAVTVDSDAALTLGGASLDIDADGGAVTIDATGAISLDAAAASNFTTTAGDMSVVNSSADSKILIQSALTGSATAIHIDGNSSAGSIVDIDGGVLDLDATGALNLDGGSINVGTAADVVVDVNASQLDIDASDWVKIDAADEIELTTTSADGHITLHSAHTAGQAILIDANAAAGAILDVDAGILTVDTQGAATHTVGGAFLVDGASTVGIQGAGTISIGTADEGTAVNIGHSTSEVTIGDNLVVTGDLTVNGTNTVVNSTVTTMDDPLIVLGKDNPGTARDLGIIFEQSGSATNLGFFYDRTASQFVMQSGLSEAGTTSGDITLGSYAALQVAALNATSGDFSGDMTAATITMTGFSVDADGDTALKTLAVDTGSTIGCDADTDLLTLSAQSVVVAADSAITYKGTAVTSTGAELNQVDGDTSATDITVATGDRVVYNDNGTMMQVTVDKLGEYFGSGDGIQESSGVLSLDPVELVVMSGSTNSVTSGNSITLADNHSSAILADSFEVYLNGMLLTRSGSISQFASNAGDYSVSGTTLTLVDALDSDDVLTVRYIKK